MCYSVSGGLSDAARAALRGVKIYAYEVGLALPAASAGGNVRRGLLVKVGGKERQDGWGEIAPLKGFSAESLDEAASQLHRWRAVPTYDLEGLLPSVRCGLEQALESWCAWPGLRPRRQAVRMRRLLLGTSQDILGAARACRAAGYRAVKLKVGRRDIDTEIVLVRRVRRMQGPGAGLVLDANRAWSLEEAAEFGRGVRAARVDYIEEPLRESGQLEELALRYDVPVALDETLAELTPPDLGKHAYATAAVLKPMVLGGYARTLRWAMEAARHGMRSAASSFFETGVGLSGLVRLASALPQDQPAGLDTSRFLARDVVRPSLGLDRPVVKMEAASLSCRQVDTSEMRQQ